MNKKPRPNSRRKRKAREQKRIADFEVLKARLIVVNETCIIMLVVEQS